MSFLCTLKIKFSSKFCKTRVNLAYTASKICSIMNSFIRDWTKRTSSLLSLKLYTRVIAQDFLECVLLNRLGGHSPRKPRKPKTIPVDENLMTKAFKAFFLCLVMSSSWTRCVMILVPRIWRLDQHWSAARACLRHLIIALIWVYGI